MLALRLGKGSGGQGVVAVKGCVFLTDRSVLSTSTLGWRSTRSSRCMDWGRPICTLGRKSRNRSVSGTRSASCMSVSAAYRRSGCGRRPGHLDLRQVTFEPRNGGSVAGTGISLRQFEPTERRKPCRRRVLALRPARFAPFRGWLSPCVKRTKDLAGDRWSRTCLVAPTHHDIRELLRRRG